MVDSSDNATCKYDDGSIYKGLITGTEEAPGWHGNLST